VTPGLDFPQLRNRVRRINLRRVEAGVAEKFLGRALVGAVLQKVRRAGVPEGMTAAGLADLRSLDGTAHPFAKIVRIEAPAAAAEEERGFTR